MEEAGEQIPNPLHHFEGQTGLKLRKRRHSAVPAFLQKLHQILEDQTWDQIISWEDNGHSFIVKNQVEFCNKVLARYFKHKNLSSFVRQLNMYGFKKDKDKKSAIAFRHERRIKDIDELVQIRRSKPGDEATALMKSEEQEDPNTLMYQMLADLQIQLATFKLELGRQTFSFAQALSSWMQLKTSYTSMKASLTEIMHHLRAEIVGLVECLNSHRTNEENLMDSPDPDSYSLGTLNDSRQDSRIQHDIFAIPVQQNRSIYTGTDEFRSANQARTLWRRQPQQLSMELNESRLSYLADFAKYLERQRKDQVQSSKATPIFGQTAGHKPRESISEAEAQGTQMSVGVEPVNRPFADVIPSSGSQLQAQTLPSCPNPLTMEEKTLHSNESNCRDQSLPSTYKHTSESRSRHNTDQEDHNVDKGNLSNDDI